MSKRRLNRPPLAIVFLMVTSAPHFPLCAQQDESQSVAERARQLASAIQSGNEAAARRILEEERQAANYSHGQIEPPLHLAITRRRPEIAELLVRFGADLNSRNRQQFSPLIAAAVYNEQNVFRLLLEKGADPNLTDKQGMDALMHGMSRGFSPDLVKQIIDRGCRLDRTSRNHQTALHMAIMYRNPDVAKLLIQEGADVNQAGQHGWTALCYAVANGEEGLVDLLLERGADPNVVTPDQNNLLLIATQSGKPAMVKRMLEIVKDKAPVNQQGMNPVQGFVMYGMRDMKLLKQLIDQGNELNSVTKGLEVGTPLMATMTHLHLDTARKLLEWGADPNLANEQGQTPLHVAAAGGFHAHWYRGQPGHRKKMDAFAQLLIEFAADPNVKNKAGQTVLELALDHDAFEMVDILLNRLPRDAVRLPDYADLHWACRKQLPRVVRFLLERDASQVNAMDSRGLTPMLAACWHGNEAIFDLLVLFGADIQQRDPGGETALHFAAWKGHTGIVKRLLQSGLDVNLATPTGYTPLHAACWQGHLPVAEALLRGGARVDPPDSDGMTPLHKAAHRGHLSVVKRLRESNADVTALDKAGFDSVIKAENQGHTTVADYLKSWKQGK